MSEAHRCPQCGAEVPEDAPEGLCPNCVLKAGLRTGADSLAGISGGGSTGESFVPPTPAELAPFFPDLEILELVGRGGMGVVYKARQKHLDRLVALKVLSPSVGKDPAFAERFNREARALAMLSHPHIVTVYDFGQKESLYYFLMEFVDGLTLRQLLDAGKLAPQEALAIVPQICEALQFAHDKGVVHRDIKPENILMDRSGQVKIADFGLAKLVGQEGKDFTITGAGQVMGTPNYMAPEQIEHPQEVDHRADIYALGVVFYQMLTGELPIGRFAPPSKKVQIDVRLDEVVLRALEKEPEQRYQQASDIKSRVETIVTTPPGAASAATPFGAGQGDGIRVAADFSKIAIAAILWAALFLFVAAVLSDAHYGAAAALLLFLGLCPVFGISLLGCNLMIRWATRAANRPVGGGHAADVKRPEAKEPPADPKSPSTGGPWVWADTLAFLGGIVWTSTTARQVANASALGFLGFLGCLGFLPFPGMHRCFGFSGFFGFFGLIGVAVMIEFAARHRAKKQVEGRSIRDMQCGEQDTLAAASRALPASYGAPPRLSKTALVGAVWGGPFFAIIILSLYVITLWLTLSIDSLLPLLSPILILLVATPIGVPILGYVALNQIRHSAGRLYGLGLALFDLLAFPLLALDAVIAGLGIFAARASASHWSSAAGTYGDLALVVAVLLVVVACVVIDFLTIRRVWRAVNQPPAGGLPADQPKPAGLETMRSVAAPVLAFVLGVFGFAFLLWSLTQRFESATALIRMCIFEADAKLVDQLVPGPTRKPAQVVHSRPVQTSEVSADVFARLMADGAKDPGLLDDQTREGTWWPKLATSSHYMRRGKVHGDGWVDGFLGVRRHKDVLQLRVEESVMHGMNSALLWAGIAWEGSAPQSGAARAFFIPFSRQDGTARYLVIAFEVSKPTWSDGQ